MITRPLNSGYRIGPMPTIRTTRSMPPIWISMVVGMSALGLLVALVAVLHNGVARGQQIRAAMNPSPLGSPNGASTRSAQGNTGGSRSLTIPVSVQATTAPR